MVIEMIQHTTLEAVGFTLYWPQKRSGSRNVCRVLAILFAILVSWLHCSKSFSEWTQQASDVSNRFDSSQPVILIEYESKEKSIKANALLLQDTQEQLFVVTDSNLIKPDANKFRIHLCCKDTTNKFVETIIPITDSNAPSLFFYDSGLCVFRINKADVSSEHHVQLISTARSTNVLSVAPIRRDEKLFVAGGMYMLYENSTGWKLFSPVVSLVDRPQKCSRLLEVYPPIVDQGGSGIIDSAGSLHGILKHCFHKSSSNAIPAKRIIAALIATDASIAQEWRALDDEGLSVLIEENTGLRVVVKEVNPTKMSLLAISHLSDVLPAVPTFTEPRTGEKIALSLSTVKSLHSKSSQSNTGLVSFEVNKDDISNREWCALLEVAIPSSSFASIGSVDIPIDCHIVSVVTSASNVGKPKYIPITIFESVQSVKDMYRANSADLPTFELIGSPIVLQRPGMPSKIIGMIPQADSIESIYQKTMNLGLYISSDETIFGDCKIQEAGKENVADSSTHPNCLNEHKTVYFATDTGPLNCCLISIKGQEKLVLVTPTHVQEQLPPLRHLYLDIIWKGGFERVRLESLVESGNWIRSRTSDLSGLAITINGSDHEAIRQLLIDSSTEIGTNTGTLQENKPYWMSTMTTLGNRWLKFDRVSEDVSTVKSTSSPWLKGKCFAAAPGAFPGVSGSGIYSVQDGRCQLEGIHFAGVGISERNYNWSHDSISLCISIEEIRSLLSEFVDK